MLLRKTAPKYWNDLIHAKTREQKLEDAVLTLTNFYKDVTLCAEINKCDHVVSCRHFKRDMDALRNSHAKLLAEWEAAYRESFRAPLDEFVTKVCK